jgi:aldose 1-epimerase
MSIEKRSFGKLQDGTEAYIFKLANSQNMVVEITNFGGIILSVKVPDRNGKIGDVTLGYEKLEAYEGKGPYFGAIIGRHANRIEDSRFELDGVEYQLARNNGKNHLHGGNKGFDKVMWQAEVINKPEAQSLQLTYRSKDGEENYPGNLDVKVNYTLTNENELKIDYFAVSDKKTVVNLTNHAYFNLSGHDSGDILKHELKIYADKFTVIDTEGIPTGEIREVRNTPMDFSDFTPVGLRIDADDEQIICGKGYDHNWVLNAGGNGLEKAAELYDPDSGRFMEVYTTKPGIQFYSANFLTGSDIGKGGAVYNKRSGLCLETQYFPNALKHKYFPSPILEAGSEYAHTTVYKFTNVK